MLKVAMLALGASLTAGALAPNEAAAQLSGRERAEAAKKGGGVIVEERRDSRVDDRRDGRCYDGRYADRYGRCDNDDDWGKSSHKSKGPKFCQNGQGHPVHGRAWCRDKGWSNTSLRNIGWEDVILRRPRDAARRDLGRSVLQDILGSVVLGRFDQQRYRLGARDPLVGYWSDTSYGSVLDLFSGRVQVAQVLDRNRDGRADVVLLNYGR